MMTAVSTNRMPIGIEQDFTLFGRIVVTLQFRPCSGVYGHIFVLNLNNPIVLR